MTSRDSRNSSFRELRRLLILGGVCACTWLCVFVSDLELSDQGKVKSSLYRIPPLTEWHMASVQWPHLLPVYIEKDEENSATHMDDQWWVTLEGDDQRRAIDPYLLERLTTSFSVPIIIETRELLSEDDARQLGLSDVALELKIVDQNSEHLRLRIGAEHRRHSTWVRKVSDTGQASPIAWRVNQRLRRALDHLPPTWPDRRFGLRKGGELVKVNCHRGGRDTVSRTPHSMSWSIIRDQETADWTIETEGLAPPLDHAATQGFTYTLQTLKVSHYLRRGEAEGMLSPHWRPTHHCSWEGASGEKGWVELGRARLNHRGEGRGAQDKKRAMSDLHAIAVGPWGSGVLPPHIAHFVTPELVQLLNRALSPIEPSRLIEVSYHPPPSPLLHDSNEDSQSLQSPWYLRKKNTGWWMEKFQNGEWVKSPISEIAMRPWLSLLTQQSASVSDLSSKTRADLVETGDERATLILTFAKGSQVCPIAIDQSKRCDLVFRALSPTRLLNRGLKVWRRTMDGVEFTLTEQHSEALVRGPSN